MDRWEEDYLLWKWSHLWELDFTKKNIMNREEIEKEFDERFWDLWKIDVFHWWIPVWYINKNDDIISFFLDEILPEVLKDIMPIEFQTTNKAYNKWVKDTITQIKTLAKKYNINL